jgi:SAM-dependent methyltransferase
MTRASEREQSRRAEIDVLWHDLECGAYDADLPLWERLAVGADGPVLDLGCGSGRVALHLARHGHRVVGIDTDAGLVAALNERAAGLPAEAAVADARDFELEEQFGLVVGPMQLAQLLGGADGLSRCLDRAARHLEGGGRAAFAIVERLPAPVEAPPPLPDACEVDGWVHSSLPLESAIDDGRLVVRRLRQSVSPSGEFSEGVDEVELTALSAAELGRAGREAGFRAAERVQVPPTDDHVGSTVVILGRS